MITEAEPATTKCKTIWINIDKTGNARFFQTEQAARDYVGQVGAYDVIARPLTYTLKGEDA